MPDMLLLYRCIDCVRLIVIIARYEMKDERKYCMCDDRNMRNHSNDKGPTQLLLWDKLFKRKEIVQHKYLVTYPNTTTMRYSAV